VNLCAIFTATLSDNGFMDTPLVPPSMNLLGSGHRSGAVRHPLSRTRVRNDPHVRRAMPFLWFIHCGICFVPRLYFAGGWRHTPDENKIREKASPF
jgi:hypothetical protein